MARHKLLKVELASWFAAPAEAPRSGHQQEEIKVDQIDQASAHLISRRRGDGKHLLYLTAMRLTCRICGASSAKDNMRYWIGRVCTANRHCERGYASSSTKLGRCGDFSSTSSTAC